MINVKLNKKIKVAILGSGNIGMDLMIKIMRTSQVLEMGALVGIDAESDGIQRAKRLKIETSHDGLDGLIKMPIWKDIDIVFDATSAGAHKHHNAMCQRDGKQMIDLTPAAIGPYCIPVVNIEKHLSEMNVNMVTCGGQATIPMVYAIKRVSERVPYAEIVASISSKSAGPGTRANIDEFTETTSRGIEQVGGAEKGKAIIVLNPAEPPMLMRDTIYAFAVGSSEEKIKSSVAEMEQAIRSYVPGYRLKQEVQFEEFTADNPLKIPGLGEFVGLKCSVFVEVKGAAHYLPAYAGNLDIMTSAGLATAERIATLKFGAEA
jgi:acetaldehyde dehydrogenase